MGSKIKKRGKKVGTDKDVAAREMFGTGKLLLDSVRHVEVTKTLRTAMQADPSCAMALNQLAGFLAKADRKEEARSLVDDAFDQEDSSPQGLLARGIAYSNIGESGIALELLDRARQLDPSLDWAVLLVRGNIYGSEDKWDLGIQMADVILNETPDNLEALQLKKKCLYYLSDRASEVAVTRRILEIAPDMELHSRLLFSLLFLADSTPESVYAESCRWFSQYGAGLNNEIKPHANTPDPRRKLRVGYVSSDLRNHAIMKLLPAIFECHDESQFEVIIYSVGADKDQVTEELAHTLKNFVPLDSDGDRLAGLVRADRIDILVDLAGHTMPSSAHLAFARKPAPVQVTWLGVVSTTGMPTIDYFIGDAHMPCPGTEHLFTETVYRLPRIPCSYRPTADVAIAESPLFKNGYITFGSFNDPHKITRQVVKLWSVILHMVPDSKILFKYSRLEKAIAQVQLREWFIEDGISSERICFEGASLAAQYLAAWGKVDIALDPFPYNGGTTTMDALWMGVPVVSLAGRLPVSRSGASLLSAVGLPVAYTWEQYVSTTMFLVESIPKTPGIRLGIRQAMSTSALVDEVGLARTLEAAYRDMWGKWCESQTRIGD